jgi:hypothetical protein
LLLLAKRRPKATRSLKFGAEKVEKQQFY